jgi:hypothetical protein
VHGALGEDMRAFGLMYHLELRHFPHNASRFNLSEQELRAIVEPWVREQVVEFGERKWSPHMAKITILEGPRLEIAQLNMGRGWRSAQRASEDVTERVLEAAREASQAQVQAAPGPSAPALANTGEGGADGLADAALSDPVALGVQLAALLGSDPMGLLEAWRAAAARSPGLTPSESLALAEHAVRSARRDQG